MLCHHNLYHHHHTTCYGTPQPELSSALHKRIIKKKAKAQVLGIAPLNMRSMCQRRFTMVEVVTDQHWL